MTEFDPHHFWLAALGELELQMTRATFDTWLRDTHVIGLDGATLIVGVKNGYAVEWLTNRLYPTIERTRTRLAQAAVTDIKFVVWEPTPIPLPATSADAATGLPAWDAPDFDPGDTKKISGWIPLSEYATLFWAPLLGPTAWRVWEIVRRGDKRKEKEEFTPTIRYSVPQLARLVPCTQQTLTGRNVRCAPDIPGAQQIEARGGRTRLAVAAETIWAKHMPGAFDILQRENVAEIERQGNRKAAVVMIAVRVSLPLLHPAQVDRLSADLQMEHDRWIGDHGLDPQDWQ